MKSLRCISFIFLCLMTSLSFGTVAVELLPDGIPADIVITPVGSTFTIDLSITFDDPFPEFYGVIALEGVGVLEEPVYLLDPGLIMPPEIPPIPLGDNTWAIYYVPANPMVTPPPGVFAILLYDAIETGIGTVNLYQTDVAFSSLTLIDSFEIQVIPEPATLLLIASGTLLIRRKR